MKHSDAALPFALGVILSGYMMLFPFWAVGALWNRVQPGRCLNPWILPSLVCALWALCFLITYASGSFRFDYPMVIIGLMPATLGCLLAAKRWRRPDESLDVTRPE